MKHPTQDEFPKNSGADAGTSEAEETLRLIARLPVPEGLEDRVQSRLGASQIQARPIDAPRAARVLAWPAALHPANSWIRAAAAAAIVFVVAGGGWGVYSRVQPAQLPQSAKAIVMPPRAVSLGGFSNAGAMHVPTTLNGPIIATPAANPAANPVANPAAAKPATPKAAATAKKPVRRAHAAAAAKPAKQESALAPAASQN
jgi:hypothetical protein